MSPDLDGGDRDEQDQSEVFDEDNTNLDELRSFGDVETLEELPDVFDVTSALGDEDDDEALIGDDLEDEQIVSLSEDLGDDGEDDDHVEREGLSVSSEDEVELEYVGDINDLAHARSAAQPFESRRLSDEDLRDLHYSQEDTTMDGLPHSARENDVEGLKDKDPDARDVDTAAEDLPEDHPKRRQEELLDEGVEETFPASDPVSVKRIT